MQKVILYYKFTPIKDPEALKLWQKNLCEQLTLQGRIIISTQGINGTLGGSIKDLKRYIKETRLFLPLKDMIFKWGEGSREDFPKLSVRVRDEIVTFGALKELKVNTNGVIGRGKHLSPKALHALVKKRGQEVIFLDARNSYEAAVGRFKNAVVANARTSKDFVKELNSGKYDHTKDKPVITYCTGGVRCEVLSALMKNRGWKEVYQLDGGIVKYGEAYADQGLWEGSLYVFDRRMGIKFSSKAKDIGSCSDCQTKTSRYTNCANTSCNELILKCQDCSKQSFCSVCSAKMAAV